MSKPPKQYQLISREEALKLTGHLESTDFSPCREVILDESGNATGFGDYVQWVPKDMLVRKIDLQP